MKSSTASRHPALKLVFDEKPYALGGSIEVRIELSSKRKLSLREGTLELFRRSVWLDQKKLGSKPRLISPGYHYFSFNTKMSDILNKAYDSDPSIEYKKFETQKAVFEAKFKDSEVIDRDLSQVFRVQVKIPLEKPPEGLLEQTWWLVGKLNIAKARDVTVRKQVWIT